VRSAFRLRLRNGRVVHGAAQVADRLVDRLAHPVDGTERRMRLECAPRIKRKVFAEPVLLGRIERLLGDSDGRGLVERRVCLLPFRLGVPGGPLQQRQSLTCNLAEAIGFSNPAD
jgi:hypothetical protein